MKILGIGVDIIQNSRIGKSITNDKFLLRIFTNEEINKSKRFSTIAISLSILLMLLLQ